jgi:hypothetical protein
VADPQLRRAPQPAVIAARASSVSGRARAKPPAAKGAARKASRSHRKKKRRRPKHAPARQARRCKRRKARQQAKKAFTRKKPPRIQGYRRKKKLAGTSLRTCHLLVFACKLLLQWLARAECGVPPREEGNETNAAASRWRQWDGRSVQDVRDERRRSECQPAKLDPDHDDFEEDEEVETSSVLTSSDDDEGVAEETVIVVVEEPASKPAVKKAAKKKAPAKKAAAARLR